MRLNLSLTQEGLARLLNVSSLTVSRWERDAVSPSDLAVQALAALFVQQHQGIRCALPACVYTEFKRLASRANGIVSKLLLQGVLVAGSCQDCGAASTCFDHRDYLLPNVADAVCHRCNAKRGVAMRTFFDHIDYWQKFDWTDRPLQPLALSRRDAP